MRACKPSYEFEMRRSFSGEKLWVAKSAEADYGYDLPFDVSV